MGTHERHTAAMSDNEFNVETTDSGASAVVSVEAGQIRKGGFIMIKGKACKVRDVSTSKTGKHGHAKCKFAATDIFTGATCEELCPSTHSIDVLLMDEAGEMREDMKMPSEDYKTDDDADNSRLIREYMEMVDNDQPIEIYCTVLSAIGK